MPSRERNYLIIILILAAFLRIADLGSESLWLDEGFTARRAHDSVTGLIKEFSVETQSAAYYFIERAWCEVFGISEFSLRFPSAVYGILAVLAIFFLARRLFGVTVAYVSGLLLAVNPFAIFYSQDARPYSLFLLAAVISLLCLLRLLEKWSMWRTLTYVFFTAFALYTQPLAPLLLVAHAATFLILRNDAAYPEACVRPWRFVRLAALVVILYIPQVLLQLHSIIQTAHGRGRASWIPTPSLYGLGKTFAAYFMYPPLGVLIVLLILWGLAFGWRRSAKDRRGLMIAFALIVALMIIPWLESLILIPVYVDRYTIPALAGVILMAGWGVSIFSFKPRIAALIVVMSLSSFTLYHYYTEADKDPWRQTAEIVRNEARPGDEIVLIEPFSIDVFTYYYYPSPDIDLTVPRYEQPIPKNLGMADRVLVVKSYTSRKSARNDSLFAQIESSRVLVKNIAVTKSVKLNPWSYWIADIRVLVYERAKT